MGRRDTQREYLDFEGANQRGVFGTLRGLEAESHKRVQEGLSKLPKIMGGSGIIYDNQSVSLIALKSFTAHTLSIAPPTKEIVAEVESCSSPMDVMIGGIELYGTRRVPKLAFNLFSANLRGEYEELKHVYADNGAMLKTEHAFEEEEYRPHLTVAGVNSQDRFMYCHRSMLDQLNIASGLVGQMITLRAVEVPELLQ